MAYEKYISSEGKWKEAKYKGKKYYLKSYADYTIDSDSDYDYVRVSFSAGFSTMVRSLSMGAITLKACAKETINGKTKTLLSTSEKKNFNAKVTSSVKYPKVPYMVHTWAFKRTDAARNIVLSFDGDMGTTRFSGKKPHFEIKLNIARKGTPSAEFYASRNDTSADFEIKVTAPRAGAEITEPEIKLGGTEIENLTWKINGTSISFPYTMTSATQTLESTKTELIDDMHPFNFNASYKVDDTTFTQESLINELSDPIWKGSILMDGFPLPELNKDGTAKIRVYSGTGSSKKEIPNDDGWEIRKESSTKWYVDVELGEDYVGDGSVKSTTATITVEYDTYASQDSETVEKKMAIYNTSRNCSYTTGLANNIFIGGCGYEKWQSRVWYSAPNEPTYIPDTNYIEVGTNDTRVMGLVKVGDYLGIIKQSKTTDTSVFLSYATSFDNDTTFATKPCIGGVGAIGEFTFNVLGDETLFLSPRGVMAIEPSEDEQSRVKNRSYFIDGALLEEPHLADAYSFVWKGYYMLCINDKIYVLDGSQRNSWGNEKTNLVYECYYLEDIPAKCVASFDDELYFSDYSGNLCRFKNASDDEPYADYDPDTGLTVPVSVEWSTLADDDGRLNYYKTMKKRGNAVSFLPEDGGEGEVYIKKDENDEVALGTKAIPPDSKLPTDYYLRKKCKKYKRLQFIIRESSSNPFGINQIVKSYTLGNYARK